MIAPQPFFSCRGTPLSVYYRTLITAELGIPVDLLTYGEGEDVDIPGVNIIRIPHFNFLGPVKIGPSALKLFLDIFLIIWATGLLLKHRYQIVHAHEEAVFFCSLLKPIFRFQLIYDMHSSLPEQLRNFEFTRSKWLIGAFSWLERHCLRIAEVTITICPSLENYAHRLASPSSFVTLIENSIFEDIRFSKPVLEPQPLEQSLMGRRLVVYAGTLENYQGIDILIHGFRAAMESDPSLYLLILGGTPAQIKRYMQMAERCGISQRCHFMGRVSPQLARYYSSMGAVQVSPRTSGTNTPLKVYEQIASGVPLVATNIYSHTQVLDKSVAFLVEPTAQGIADGILAATRAPGSLSMEKVEKAQRLYEKRYSRRIYADKMRAIFAHLGADPLSAISTSVIEQRSDLVELRRGD